jgi:signal transduction histidine kinase
MSAEDTRGAITRYVPMFRPRVFYRASFVLLSAPVVVQAGLFAWLWFQLPHGDVPGVDLALVPALYVLGVVTVHLRLRSLLRAAHARTSCITAEEGPSENVDRIILELFRLPRKLLVVEAPLAMALIVPLATVSRVMDPQLVAPLLLVPAAILLMLIPPYIQSELWEIRRVVRFLPPPTDPAVLRGHMRTSYLMGGILVLIPTGLALLGVYEAAHVLLLAQGGTVLNIVRHVEAAPLAVGAAILAVLMALTWWIGSRTGRELVTISRFFEEAFRRPAERSSGDYSMPPAGSFTVREIHELRASAKTLAARLHEIRATQLGQIAALEKAQRVKTVFLANMSHDLKSPLNSIIGFSELLLRGIEGDLTESQKQDVRLIHASGEELLNLINNILDSARLEAGKLELHKEWTPSVELVSNVVKTGMQQIGTKRITFDSEIQPGLPPVHVDPHRISQAIGNLISNAIKFMEEGQVTVRAYVHKTGDDTPLRFLRIDVQDTGKGIREEDRDRIFEAFQQIDRSYSRKKSGMGLGLTLTRNLVDLHDGKLMLTSELGKGSTFSISLPIEE